MKSFAQVELSCDHITSGIGAAMIGRRHFDSITEGWIGYSHNHVLVKVFSHALLSTSKGHEAALVKLKEDIEEQKKTVEVDMSTQTLNLFANLVVDAPQTEGIKYAGSKLKLLPYILQLVQKVKPHTVLAAILTMIPREAGGAEC